MIKRIVLKNRCLVLWDGWDKNNIIVSNELEPMGTTNIRLYNLCKLHNNEIYLKLIIDLRNSLYHVVVEYGKTWE